MSVFIAFLLVSCPSIFHFSLLCLQMQSFCSATVVLQCCNCSRFAVQKQSILNEKDCFCEARHCLFWAVMLQVIEIQCFDAKSSKLANFEPKISLCVQVAVLSDRKCKHCWEQCSKVMVLRCCFFCCVIFRTQKFLSFLVILINFAYQHFQLEK